MPLLWLVISVGLIAVALALGATDHGGAACTPSMGVVCSGQATGTGADQGLVQIRV